MLKVVGISSPPPFRSEHPTPMERPTVPVAEPPGREVWAATWDLGGLRQLSLRLHGRAKVVPVQDWRALSRATKSTIVLLDACAREIDLMRAASALEGTGAMVVVWGGDSSLRMELARDPSTRRWMHVPTDTTPVELAEMLSSMF